MPNKCVFCGLLPQSKSKEHALPQWLIALTGNPKRVVNFGTNYRTGEQVRFDWSSFVIPACKLCNTKYAELESRAKEYILKILDREALNSKEYVDLLDWFDKVRTSLWLSYHKLQGNPTNIEPKFYVDQRIAKKDRMLAIYALATDEKGLNAFGVETFLFSTQPSCFGLKINNIFMVNMSSDYLFSGRCGFPHPKIIRLLLDGENQGKTQFKKYETTRKIKHPLIEKHIIKPSIHIYQPIMPPDETSTFQSGFLGDYNLFDSYLTKNTIPPFPSGKGIIYRQYQNRVAPIFDMDKSLEFSSVSGIHSRPIHELISQVYDFQKFLFRQSEFFASDKKIQALAYERKRRLLKSHSICIDQYRNMKFT